MPHLNDVCIVSSAEIGWPAYIGGNLSCGGACFENGEGKMDNLAAARIYDLQSVRVATIWGDKD